ncbi:unnamed protein product [Protopolystoma xenopodis]|uniref:Uncharacterized protein n=1 Tax=Protopolystoma xenopodis TaxID=117903 RepID=A0A448XG02_9PLAT|nr:unnamed protein product [Protopolystoma xenopodis]
MFLYILLLVPQAFLSPQKRVRFTLADSHPSPALEEAFGGRSNRRRLFDLTFRRRQLPENSESHFIHTSHVSRSSLCSKLISGCLIVLFRLCFTIFIWIWSRLSQLMTRWTRACSMATSFSDLISPSPTVATFARHLRLLGLASLAIFASCLFLAFLSLILGTLICLPVYFRETVVVSEQASHNAVDFLSPGQYQMQTHGETESNLEIKENHGDYPHTRACLWLIDRIAGFLQA